MSKRRVVCGRRLSLHRCDGDDTTLVLRIRTRRLDVRYALPAAGADQLRDELQAWCDEIGTQLVGDTEEEEA